MRFYEFLNMMYDNSHKPSKDLYVVQLFSSLCGESDPFGSNIVYSGESKNSSKFSSTLPTGFTGTNPTYRRRLYKGDDANYRGLSTNIRNHMLGYKNKVTFVNFLEESVTMERFSNLCAVFSITDYIDRSILFESIYEQFLSFAYNPSDEVEFIVPEIVRKLLENEMEMAEPSPFQLESNLAKKESVSDNEDRKASQTGTPSEQMRKIFNKVIERYKIATYMCKGLVLAAKSEDSSIIFDFIKAVQSDILLEYPTSQDEVIYGQISKFIEEIKSYISFLKLISIPLLEDYELFWTLHPSYEIIFAQIAKDKVKVKKIIEDKNKLPSDPKEIDRLESEIDQLTFLETVFLNRKEIDSIYGKINKGKTLFVC